MHTDEQAATRTVVARIVYHDGTKPVGAFYSAQRDVSTCTFISHEVAVTDARTMAAPPRLATEGFELIRHDTAVTDYWDVEQDDRIKAEVAETVKRVTGARRVVIFQVQRRHELGEERGLPAGHAHVDYGRQDACDWMDRTVGVEEATRLRRGHWAYYNFWRGIGEVQRRPMAFADGRTIRDENLKAVPVSRSPDSPLIGYGRHLTYNPQQTWYYYPNMQENEALLFSQYDTDPAATQQVAHVAFDDPNSPADAAPRASLEARLFAFFDEE